MFVWSQARRILKISENNTVNNDNLFSRIESPSVDCVLSTLGQILWMQYDAYKGRWIVYKQDICRECVYDIVYFIIIDSGFCFIVPLDSFEAILNVV